MTIWYPTLQLTPNLLLTLERKTSQIFPFAEVKMKNREIALTIRR
jgi:hypothetical protein